MQSFISIILFRSPQWALSSSITSIGSWQLNSHMVQKHLAREKKTQWNPLERRESRILNDVILFFFPCPIASHTLWQGVFVSRDCLAAKGQDRLAFVGGVSIWRPWSPEHILKQLVWWTRLGRSHGNQPRFKLLCQENVNDNLINFLAKAF